MVNEANETVQSEAVEELEEMDFAAMLEESFKKDSGRDALIDGVIVEIKDDVALVVMWVRSQKDDYTLQS